MECSSTELGYRQNTSYRAKNVVNVLKLVTKDTIEEKINSFVSQKYWEVHAQIKGKETAEHYLIREEIIDLLSEKDK